MSDVTENPPKPLEYAAKGVPTGSVRRRMDWRTALERFGPLATLVLLIVATAVAEHVVKGTSTFLKPENLLNILRQWSFVGIIALGMTFVIISGGIDLSVGSLVAFAGGVGIWMMNTAISARSMLKEIEDDATLGIDRPYSVFRAWLAQQFIYFHIDHSEKWGVCIAVATILLTGLLAGWVNGMLIAKGRLAPFIATLGGLAAYRSMALAIANGSEFRSASTKLFPLAGTGGIKIPGLYLSSHRALMLPYPVIAFFVLAATMWVLLNKTRYGRYVYAVGSNERAVRYSAISVDRVKILTYTLSGLLCGVAAMLLASRMNSVASSSTGTLYELDVIAAVVIGGTRMNGGAGTILGTVIGVLILGVISNMLNFLDVSWDLQGLVKGVIIIVAVLMQQIGRKNN